MFRPLSLWQQIPCPALEARGVCTVTHCLFSHNIPPPPAPLLPPTESRPITQPSPTLTPTPTPPQAPPAQSTDPRKQTPPQPIANLTTSVTDTPQSRPPPPPPTPPSAPTLTGDPRLRKIIESNAAGTPKTADERRECKRRRAPDEPSTSPTPDGPADGPADGPVPAVKRTKTMADAGGSAAAAAPKSILKKSPPVAANGSKVVATPAGRGSPVSVATKSGMVTAKQSVSAKQSIPGVEAVAAAAKPLSLNPRLVPSSPATHEVRMKLLKMLHNEYIRLNGDKGDPQEMLRLALDEEEKVAKEMRSIYAQAMKKRILKLQKISVADYKKEQEEKRKQAAREEEGKKRVKVVHGKVIDSGLDNAKPPLETGLTPAEELDALRPLLHSPADLAKYKYILQPPTDEEVATAVKGIQSAGGWEACDRCNSRFQVFEGRRESDGQLASGGTCTYHWGRAAWPSRPSSGRATKDNDKIFTCCRQRMGQSAGCTTGESHVYKISEAKRLASVWQFTKTPDPPTPNTSIERAICLDCEMCYTTQGMELIRLTATTFPSGDVIVDALVRPSGDILDLNSRYSGVTPKHLMDATPHQAAPYPSTPASHQSFTNPTALPDPPSSSTSPASSAEEILPILPSPEAARALLLNYVDANTPLIGHALENDLNVLRLCHAAVIDTAILFPHVKGFPLRNKLKWLVEKHLERRIQVEGADDGVVCGHDSRVDARCAGELVRWKIKEGQVLKRSYGVKPKPDRKSVV